MKTQLSEVSIAAVRRYCESKTPPDLRNEMRLDVVVRGSTITIFDARPPWHADMGPEWTQTSVAQFRFDASNGLWSLYWADRNSRWHLYDEVEPSTNIVDLIEEVDEDPTGIFYG